MELRNHLAQIKEPKRAEILETARKSLRFLNTDDIPSKKVLQNGSKIIKAEYNLNTANIYTAKANTKPQTYKQCLLNTSKMRPW